MKKQIVVFIMPRKNVVKVRKDEKRLYRIMKDLQVEGESIIDSGSPEWHGTMRKFGLRTKSLVNNDLLEKPWIIENKQNHKIEKRLIRLPKKNDKSIVEVVEIPGNDISIFHFKRRRLI